MSGSTFTAARVDRPDIEIRQVDRSELPATVAVCSRGMLDNPIHERVFGADAARRARGLARFFATANTFIHRKGVLLGAHHEGRLIGVLGLLPPGCCRPPPSAVLRSLPGLVMGNTPLALLRLWRWLAVWRRHDPSVPHWHLGPLAVEPAYQRRGIGSRLLESGMQIPTSAGAMLYLETDKPGNVAFYQHFGFSTVGTASVLGATSWLMARML